MSDQTTTAEPQAPVAQLQLSDIVTALRAIQMAAGRGAFQAEEFTQIGGTYDRIFAFLQQSGAIKAPSETAPAEQKPVV